MQRTIFLPIFALLLIFSACKKDQVAQPCGVEDPLTELQWLKSRLEQSLSNPPGTNILVEEYTWNDSTFFLVNSCVGCPDEMKEIYNCEGVQRCSIGGIAGLQCPGFGQAVKVKTWQ